MDVRMCDSTKIISNEYNPNKVASIEFDLLIKSIEEDGFTQPVVTFYDKITDKYIVIDGFHRYLVLKNHFKCKEIPIVVLDKTINDRMASTIRHNRARGKHKVDLMSDIVKAMYEKGWEDEKIAKNIGLSNEELLRLKQVSGISKLLSGTEYSKSWEEKTLDD